MAKLIIEIIDRQIDNVCGIEVEMSHDLNPLELRQLADATVVSLGEVVKVILPKLTAELIEADGKQKVAGTSIHQDHTLAEVLAHRPARANKPH